MSRAIHVRAIASILVLAACGPGDAPPFVTPSPGAATPAVVSLAEFRTLHWYEGRWLGVPTEGARSFEAYRVVDDSTMRHYRYVDSTYSAVIDSGTIALRGATVGSSDGERSWVVTAIDSSSVSFGPWRDASDSFTWTRTGPGAWTARIRWDSAGTPREAIHSMRAVP